MSVTSADNSNNAAAQGRTQEKGEKISRVGAGDLVRQVFEMASLDSLFEFYGRLEDLGIVQASPAPAKSKEKGAGRKEKGVPLKEAKIRAPQKKSRRRRETGPRLLAGMNRERQQR